MSKCKRDRGWVWIVVALMMTSLESQAITKSQKDFVERIKSISTIDDAYFSERALVIWPSPDVQATLDYEPMSEMLCQEYKTYGYLVIWYMNSSIYRREKEMEMLQSVNCLELME
jgi:hypothetical protein